MSKKLNAINIEQCKRFSVDNNGSISIEY